MLAAALDYADRGWRVFPTAGKIPRTPRGCLDATTDRDQVAEWWRMWSTADIGVATGHRLVVLDVDGEPGADTLHELERAHEEIPRTVAAITGSGSGAHYFLAATVEVRNSAGLLGAGVDVRGDGGYVIVPPSSHKSGRRYEWNSPPDECEVAPLPAWLLALLTEPARGAARPPSAWRALAASGAELGARNDSTARLVGHLLARKVDPFVVVELLVGWDQTCNRPPLGRDEVEKTVESIARRELARRR